MLTRMEERVRAAGTALGDLVDPADVPPLRLPAPDMDVWPPGRLARAMLAAARLARAKWLIPLAGAVGVVAVAAVAAAVVHANPDSQMADSAAVPAAPSGGAGPPPFAVTVNELGAAAVQQVATARTVARIQYAPGVTGYLAAAADAGRRTVVLAGQLRGGVAFYVIRLTADGMPDTPSPVPGSQDRMLGFLPVQPAAQRLELTMTPDGSRFAYLLRTPPGTSPARMVLGAENIATGAARNWVLTGGAVRWQDAVTAAAQVTLDGTGQQLLVAMHGSLRSVDVRSGQVRQLSFPAFPRLNFDLAW